MINVASLHLSAAANKVLMITENKPVVALSAAPTLEEEVEAACGGRDTIAWDDSVGASTANLNSVIQKKLESLEEREGDEDAETTATATDTCE